MNIIKRNSIGNNSIKCIDWIIIPIWLYSHKIAIPTLQCENKTHKEKEKGRNQTTQTVSSSPIVFHLSIFFVVFAPRMELYLLMDGVGWEEDTRSFLVGFFEFDSHDYFPIPGTPATTQWRERGREFWENSFFIMVFSEILWNNSGQNLIISWRVIWAFNKKSQYKFFRVSDSLRASPMQCQICMPMLKFGILT